MLDLGHKSVAPNSLLPSEARRNVASVPLLGMRATMPSWEVGICLPLDVLPLTEKQESEVFKRVCPIPPSESYAATYHALFGVLGSVLSNDSSGFSCSLRNLQNCLWKRSEIGAYGTKISRIMSVLYKSGAQVVGMSSMGPTLFYLGPNCQTITERATRELSNCKFFITKARNSGRRIRECLL